jgi:hypothetical protein
MSKHTKKSLCLGKKGKQTKKASKKGGSVKHNTAKKRVSTKHNRSNKKKANKKKGGDITVFERMVGIGSRPDCYKYQTHGRDRHNHDDCVRRQNIWDEKNEQLQRDKQDKEDKKIKDRMHKEQKEQDKRNEQTLARSRQLTKEQEKRDKEQAILERQRQEQKEKDNAERQKRMEEEDKLWEKQQRIKQVDDEIKHRRIRLAEQAIINGEDSYEMPYYERNDIMGTVTFYEKDDDPIYETEDKQLVFFNKEEKQKEIDAYFEQQRKKSNREMRRQGIDPAKKSREFRKSMGF